MTKSKLVYLLLGTSGLFLAMGMTHNEGLLGAIVGYWTSFLYTQWLYKNTQRNVELEISMAIRQMRRSFFARLGFVTLVVAAVGRYQKEWLFSLALGFALGLVVSLIVGIIEYMKAERGEL
ncbi:hypothetical protein [Desulfitobacterium metallireducens]|uniref:ATP synthase I n=1 Tax=Desulfitobacterium metallireducens DSM 15288 TaxID=871968 RepID=W0EBN9_9FIRM|nr:hypothetical protein [Desulfitobacterium metallireducens]AHF08275.1 ATP synthase I [Desulfitobacterium metallireducens DSM 15288]